LVQLDITDLGSPSEGVEMIHILIFLHAVTTLAIR
jgi:hypothetical protein